MSLLYERRRWVWKKTSLEIPTISHPTSWRYTCSVKEIWETLCRRFNDKMAVYIRIVCQKWGREHHSVKSWFRQFCSKFNSVYSFLLIWSIFPHKNTKASSLISWKTELICFDCYITKKEKKKIGRGRRSWLLLRRKSSVSLRNIRRQLLDIYLSTAGQPPGWRVRLAFSFSRPFSLLVFLLLNFDCVYIYTLSA